MDWMIRMPWIMKITRYAFLLILLFGIGCTVDTYSPGATTDQPGENKTSTVELIQTPVNSAVSTTGPPTESSQNSTISSELNPLTGLPGGQPGILDRRPILIKVENLPRLHRPQWGMSNADQVYEYYTEEGTTRFASIFYGQNSSMVGPIRSARYFDIQLIQMYKAVFVFGSAYPKLLEDLQKQNFSNRLIIEQPNSCPALCRFDPDGQNLLIANIIELENTVKNYGIDNVRQNLGGMAFSTLSQPGGQIAEKVYLRFSGAIYNRWDFDSSTGKYYRFEETQNDVNRDNEVYAALTDRLTGQQISAENIAVLFTEYVALMKPGESEVYDIPLTGSGIAYVIRDGALFKVFWHRDKPTDLVSFTFEDGTPFGFKPGQTWFEILGKYSYMYQDGKGWRFEFVVP